MAPRMIRETDRGGGRRLGAWDGNLQNLRSTENEDKSHYYTPIPTFDRVTKCTVRTLGRPTHFRSVAALPLQSRHRTDPPTDHPEPRTRWLRVHLRAPRNRTTRHEAHRGAEHHDEEGRLACALGRGACARVNDPRAPTLVGTPPIHATYTYSPSPLLPSRRGGGTDWCARHISPPVCFLRARA